MDTEMDVVLKKVKEEFEGETDINLLDPAIEPIPYPVEEEEENEVSSNADSQLSERNSLRYELQGFSHDLAYVKHSVSGLNADSTAFEYEKASIITILSLIDEQVKRSFENEASNVQRRAPRRRRPRISTGNPRRDDFLHAFYSRFFDDESDQEETDSQTQESEKNSTYCDKVCGCCIPVCLALSVIFICAQIVDFLFDLMELVGGATIFGDGTAFYAINGIRILTSVTFVCLFCTVCSHNLCRGFHCVHQIFRCICIDDLDLEDESIRSNAFNYVRE